jgi:hypothetical protein
MLPEVGEQDLVKKAFWPHLNFWAIWSRLFSEFLSTILLGGGGRVF